MSENKVFNWQLGREMEYPYPESRPDKQAAWIFDTNKCIACQTCTMACKNAWTSGKGQEHVFWNNVETKPWGFYPLAWDLRLLKKLGGQKWEGNTYKGKTIFESKDYGEKIEGFMPLDEDYQYPNLGEDEINVPVGQGEHFSAASKFWMFYLPRICNHCTYPGCLGGCPRKSIYKRKEDGTVLIDQKRCRGYQECVRTCPYKKSFFRSFTGKSEKCIACYPATEKGDQTQCVQNCIGKIRLFGFKNAPDKADPNNPIDYLVHIKKMALPLYPQFGTEPNVYYIPPMNAPKAFNKQLFGPGAENAIESYKQAHKDTNLIGLFMLFGSTGKRISSYKVEGDLETGFAMGYDDKGEEVVKVPIKEPIIIRQKRDEKRNVSRISIT